MTLSNHELTKAVQQLTQKINVALITKRLTGETPPDLQAMLDARLWARNKLDARNQQQT